MSSPLNDVLAGFSRKYRKKAKQVEPLIQKYLDEGMTPAHAVDKALKETDFKSFMTKAVKDAMLSSAVIGAGSYTAGESTPLDEAWDPSGMTLSEKLHGTSKAMRNHIVNTIKEQLKQGAHAMKSARALYDGYNTTGNVVRKQMLPKYLQDVVNFSRRSDLGKNDVIALQKLVRKARRMVDRMAQNGAPNRALKTSYKELLDAVKSCSDKALKRAIRTAVEEKSRYVAERIARTESARAWYQGFLKDTMDDPDVVAYRWVESTRHPTEDICDEYAKVDMYGLGPGIFPKDKAPELPAHPHCLCHYEKVYASELDSYVLNDRLEKEEQRYGRNKETTINHAYINSGEYRRKFDKITDNPDVNRALYYAAKQALIHRSGTRFEDMFWIDKTTGKVVGKILDSTIEEKIVYNKGIIKLVKDQMGNLITLHTHPGSLPPSIADLNTGRLCNYVLGVVACHNGKVYIYKSQQDVPQMLYSLYIANYLGNGYNEEEAQIRALAKLSRSYRIYFKEVI